VRFKKGNRFFTPAELADEPGVIDLDRLGEDESGAANYAIMDTFGAGDWVLGGNAGQLAVPFTRWYGAQGNGWFADPNIRAAEPGYPYLAESDYFEWVPGAGTPADPGRIRIKEPGSYIAQMYAEAVGAADGLYAGIEEYPYGGGSNDSNLITATHGIFKPFDLRRSDGTTAAVSLIQTMETHGDVANEPVYVNAVVVNKNAGARTVNRDQLRFTIRPIALGFLPFF
jgi:hypothetical protein